MARIEIVPYNPKWPTEFETMAGKIRKAFGDSALRIDHIGSTSVPGLAAKDVIDLQVTVRSLDRGVIAPLAEVAGYIIHPDTHVDHVPPGGSSDPTDWAKFMLKPVHPTRRIHVHIRQEGKANQRYPILFRDYLRSSPTATEAYRQIKVALARLHPDDMDAYYNVKDPVCDLIIDAAERWAKDTSWTPAPSDA
jgi:GrpB-like predicted nucleotidyltransferase (UPF0157 family)